MKRERILRTQPSQSRIMEEMKLDKQLKDLLRQSDMNVAQLARASRVSAKTIYNWLAGQKPKDLDSVKRVADHFNISIDQLCYGNVSGSPISGREFEHHLDEVNAGIFEVVLRRVRK